MKVLYSTQSVVRYDGTHYSSTPIKSMYPRYLPLGEDIVVLSYMKKISRCRNDILDDEVRVVTAQKVNSLKGMLLGKRKENNTLIDQLVREVDVCVAHVPCELSNKVITYCKKYGKPYMTVVCGCPWDAMWNFDWRGKLLAPWAFLKLRRIQKKTPFSIYVTNEFLQRRYPTNGRSIGCSNVNIPTGLDGVLEHRLENIKKHQQQGCALKIGTAAALNVTYKGQEYVIRALSRLKRENVDFEYHLIGSGDPERLRGIAEIEGVSDRVFFHGPLPHSKVLDFMDEMDIYVQPSKQEGLPRSAIEAMSRGCLCVGSRIAGIPELLEPQFLFGKGNVKELAAILKGISYDSLVDQARRNFNKAKEYDCDLLNQRRRQFIEEFKRSFAKK